MRDVALHLLGGDIGQLSGDRDKFQTGYIKASRWEELVELINEHNENWVKASARFSPRFISDSLKWTGD